MIGNTFQNRIKFNLQILNCTNLNRVCSDVISHRSTIIFVVHFYNSFYEAHIGVITIRNPNLELIPRYQTNPRNQLFLLRR